MSWKHIQKSVCAFVLAICPAAFADVLSVTTENFSSDTDLTWENQRTRVTPNNFGWSNTDFTGTAVGANTGTTTFNGTVQFSGAGELGGQFSRTQAADPLNPLPSEAVVYDTPIGSFTPNDAFSFSAVIRYITRSSTNTGTRIGFGNGQNTWVGPSNFLSILYNSGTTPQIQIYNTSGTLIQNVVAPAGPLRLATTGGGAVTTPFGTVADSGVATFIRVDYDPNGNGGLGSVTYSSNGASMTANFTAGQKAQLANFTHFGIVNPRAVAAGTVEEYFDDITFSSPEPGCLALLTMGSLITLRRPCRARA